LTDTFEAPEFAIHVDRDGLVASVMVVGELDIATVPELRAAIASVEPGYEELVIDLSTCAFFASSGISTLLEENARAEREGFRLVVVKAAPEVQRIFDITSLEKTLTFRES
jgi:anti-sigma B factor antagonist